jgi:hypothetical protein
LDFQRRVALDIDKLISDLLFDYDCVIVPQLGGFVSNYRPAQIDDHKGIAQPAGKDIRFNKNLVNSDGLLEKAISEAEGISFEEAGGNLKQSVEGYWKTLNGGSEVAFEKVGVLYIDSASNLRFEPAKSQNYLKASFGLEGFVLPPAREEKVPEQASEQFDLPADATPIFRERVKSQHTRGIYWVAAATLLPFLALSLYIGLSTNFESPARLSVADVLPFKTSTDEPVQYKERPADNAIAGEISEEEGFPKDQTFFPFSFEKNQVDSDGVIIDLSKKRAAKKQIPENGSNQKYHIIAGCFGVEENAVKYARRLSNKGYDAGVLDYHKGLHRVKLNSYADYTEALNTLKALRDEKIFPSAWLLKKPVA